MGCCASSQAILPPPAPIAIKIDPSLPPAEQEAIKEKINVKAQKIAAAQKLELSAEEKVIRDEEKKIPFAQKKAKELDSALKANSMEGRLSVPQLKRATSHLQIDSEIFTNPDLAVYKFLKKFCTEKKLYEVRSLALCGILLGQGSAKEKAEVLFDHFDVDASEKLEKSELRSMLEQMVSISAGKVPISAIGEGLLTEEEASNYSKKLVAGQDAFIETIINALVEDGDGVSRVEFEKKVTGHVTLQRLLWSYGIRQSLWEEANDVFAI